MRNLIFLHRLRVDIDKNMTLVLGRYFHNNISKDEVNASSSFEGVK
jgi:hypothetical protein